MIQIFFLNFNNIIQYYCYILFLVMRKKCHIRFDNSFCCFKNLHFQMEYSVSISAAAICVESITNDLMYFDPFR